MAFGVFDAKKWNAKTKSERHGTRSPLISKLKYYNNYYRIVSL